MKTTTERKQRRIEASASAQSKNTTPQLNKHKPKVTHFVRVQGNANIPSASKSYLYYSTKQHNILVQVNVQHTSSKIIIYA